LDLVIVLDESGSIESDDFEKAKKAIVSLIQTFQIGPTDTLVSFVTFSTEARLRFKLNTYNSMKDIVDYISNYE
jgi:uncharacterized protein YegL